jgi:hypothetical protein
VAGNSRVEGVTALIYKKDIKMFHARVAQPPSAAFLGYPTITLAMRCSGDVEKMLFRPAHSQPIVMLSEAPPICFD